MKEYEWDGAGQDPHGATFKSAFASSASSPAVVTVRVSAPWAGPLRHGPVEPWRLTEYVSARWDGLLHIALTSDYTSSVTISREGAERLRQLLDEWLGEPAR